MFYSSVRCEDCVTNIFRSCVNFWMPVNRLVYWTIEQSTNFCLFHWSGLFYFCIEYVIMSYPYNLWNSGLRIVAHIIGKYSPTGKLYPLSGSPLFDRGRVPIYAVQDLVLHLALTRWFVVILYFKSMFGADKSGYEKDAQTLYSFLGFKELYHLDLHYFE